MERQEQKLIDIQIIKQSLNDFILKYYQDDVIKIEIHKNKSMGNNLSFKVFPMRGIERY